MGAVASRPAFEGARDKMRIERRYTKDGQLGLRGHQSSASPHLRSATRTARWYSSSTTSKSLISGRRLPGCPGPEIFPQGRCPCPLETGRRELGAVVPVALGSRRRAPRRLSREGTFHRANEPPSRFLTGLPGRGPTGAGRAAISIWRRRRARFLRRAARHARRRRSARPIRRSGSTPA